MANIFTCRRPNWSGVGAIDYPDRFEQVHDQHYIPDVTEKIFKDDVSMIHRQKTFIFGFLKAFINNFTYYNLCYKKVKVIARKKYAIHFLIQPLDFSLKTLTDS